jgi:hypothetical protein
VLKKFPGISREMRYVAGERKKRHEENIEMIKEKFKETKRVIVREQIQQINTDNYKIDN